TAPRHDQRVAEQSGWQNAILATDNALRHELMAPNSRQHEANRMPRMAMLQPMSSRPFFARHLWMILVMLALALRSSIPMGYMLDTAALRGGSLRIMLCSLEIPASLP